MATQSAGIHRIVSAAKQKFSVTLDSLGVPGAGHRRRAALTEQHRLSFDLLCKAMDDPALAAVLDTYESDVPLDKQRQFLFANALYVNNLYFYRIGALTRAELYGHLRVMCRNKVFREYWEATRHHRKSLPDSSEEYILGRMMDDLIHDLDDADTDEWWVVGEPPPEDAA
ncbi:hypothetical protein DF268_02965 [Streptomyces sp. V2]|uniref:DUF6082 family protein n=1 Tax=Streptomyces niveiscabiei TaxID=164115 RepID=A0ABW9HMC2_9ACTN|nr:MULTISPECIES: DUF6082 family protein [Streptomyces]MDX3380162.1 DUF6082 family protein [Streptomyces niveiscabiei]PWG15194.1 hypothetical protein DF268_02965 [Streptomyces sp. V2]QZZ30670.1 hypothetical protein A7X85_34565 [Streptomyces sp. ST1015]